MRQYILLIFSIILAFAAMADDARLSVRSINVSRTDASLRLDIDINPRNVNPGRDKEVIFTPVVIAADGRDSVVMPAVRVAGRNIYYSHLRNHDLPEGTRLYSAGAREMIEYRASVPYEPWMERCRIDMRASTARCCDPMLPAPGTPLALLDYTTPAYKPEFSFVALTGDEAVERSAEGSAFIDFIVNRTEIRPTYRRNTVELAKIIESIDLVKNDPDATITRVTIKGFASPEGSYSNNVRLAMGRTQALKEYVREHYSFDPAIMSTDYEPEDWEGLVRRLRDLELPHRDEILAIAQSDMEPDPRNAEIQRRFPEQYRFLLDSIYPALRHSDYTVKYRIRTYVDIEELKRVYASNPANLRPVDFERIAATLPEGSPEREEVYLTAYRLYPNDEEASVNAANIMMSRGLLKEAATALRTAGESPAAVYSRATLAALGGDLRRAADLFRSAADEGFAPARTALERTEALIKRPTVEYLIRPTE